MEELTDDRDHWLASLAGDGAAFAALWDRHRDRVFRSALRSAATTHDAEDLVAGAFLELWRHRARVRLVEHSVLPWLLTTSLNLGRNAARGRRRRDLFLAALPAAQPVPDHSETVLDRIDALTDERSISAVVRRLPATDRDILALVALEGLTTAQAAEALGIRPDAAKTRLARARRRARLDWAGDAGRPSSTSRLGEHPRLTEGSTS